MAKTRRTRMSAENDHRRVTRPRLWIIVKETRGYPTGYLRTQSDTIQHGPESREVGYGFSIILHGHWIKSETTQTENAIGHLKSLRYWFSYAPVRVEIGPRRELEINREVGLSF